MDALGEDLSDTEIEEMIAEADRKGLGGVTYEGKRSLRQCRFTAQFNQILAP